MDSSRLAAALSDLLGLTLAKEVAFDFVKVRQDLATKTLERASPGKFVETFVQCLQQMASGKFDAKPDVDGYLSKKAENETSLPDGLRTCAPRIARAIYTLRNKRNIAHKNPVDANSYDLAFAHQGASWIMAELLRSATGIPMQEAGALIELVQAPVGSLVEEFDGIRLVHADISLKNELLIWLHSHHPQRKEMKDILASMYVHAPGAVRSRLSELRASKHVHGDAKIGYRLTQVGFASAVKEIASLTT